ncbi:WD40-repeat-containing domain protein [Mucidula mucida]|nr:WD40-repeat-containing domain protein [Mucidula mucida]
MRVHHAAHSFQTFPVYSSSFISDNQLVLGGGGGTSRSGIKNKLRLYNVHPDRSIEMLNEFELEAGEDAPMSMAANESKNLVCGINSTEELVARGENDNCRVFDLNDNKISLLTKKGTLSTENVEDFQRVSVLSQDGTMLAAAGGKTLHLLSFPLLVPVAAAIETKFEIYDAAFSGDTLVVVTTEQLLVYNLSQPSSPSKPKKKGKPKVAPSKLVTLEHTIPLPPNLEGGQFRGGHFHPTNSQVFYTAGNTKNVRTRTSKSVPRPSFAMKWDTATWKVEKSRKIGDKPLTCFVVSPDGQYLGFGSSDLSIGLLDAATLTPTVSILKAHEFPATTICFNPSSELFVSGSADSSIRIVSLPGDSSSYSWTFVLLLVALLILLLAVGAQKVLK